MSKQTLSRLMFDWLQARHRLQVAQREGVGGAALARLDRETMAAFLAWRNAVRSLDEAA